MTQYIDKSALVAEIERLWNEYKNSDGDSKLTWFVAKLENFVNTLETKEADLEKDVRQIISLYYEGIKHYEDIIKEERKENGGSDLAVKIMDGVVDARELGIQYVINKLKAQKL